MQLDQETIAQLKALQDEAGGSLLVELTGIFRESTPERLQRMRRALAEGDAHALEREAHALKGSAGALGVSELQRLCAELEQTARARALAGAAGQLAAVESAFAAALAALQAECRC